jgi:hypothetical protein
MSNLMPVYCDDKEAKLPISKLSLTQESAKTDFDLSMISCVLLYVHKWWWTLQDKKEIATFMKNTEDKVKKNW